MEDSTNLTSVRNFNKEIREFCECPKSDGEVEIECKFGGDCVDAIEEKQGDNDKER
jgi:hypothetical protein